MSRVMSHALAVVLFLGFGDAALGHETPLSFHGRFEDGATIISAEEIPDGFILTDIIINLGNNWAVTLVQNGANKASFRFDGSFGQRPLQSYHLNTGIVFEPGTDVTVDVPGLTTITISGYVPTPVSPVPAVGTIGLIIMVGLMAVAGGYILRKRRGFAVALVSLAVMGMGDAAAAQTPFIETHFLTEIVTPFDVFFSADETHFVDFAPSMRALTLPAGTATIVWTYNASVAGIIRMRPAIGNQSPTDGIWSNGHRTSSGSWSTRTEGGQMNVGLQLRRASPPGSRAEFHMNEEQSLSWTLIVFPDAPDDPVKPVPAVSTWGLAVLALALLTVAKVYYRNGAETVVD